MLLYLTLTKNEHLAIQSVFTEQAQGGRYFICWHFDYKGEDKVRNVKALHDTIA